MEGPPDPTDPPLPGAARAPDAHAKETKTLRREPPSSTRVQPVSLRVVEGPDAGMVALFDRERISIGTHKSADFRLRDSTVSRFHCELRLQEQKIAVVDLASKNETLLDGVAILHAHARPGSQLQLGRTGILVGLADQAVERPLSVRESFGEMVGTSAAMRSVFAVLERAAETDTTLLLEGETGTGKEAAARSVHAQSARRDGPFVVVDCGAIPGELLESELFGHVRGAFTGAIAPRPGAFVSAAGGTLFLDEVGELGPELQPRLLRALEQRKVKPVGGNTYQQVDVRVIAATNRDLRSAVNEQLFRADLYYRLAVISVRLPPLRERPEDLPPLVATLLGQLDGERPLDIGFAQAPEFLERIRRHSWPGNVRELRNHLERCIALREPPPLAGEVTRRPLPFELVDTSRTLREAREQLIAEFERQYLEALLARHGGHVRSAAEAAGIARVHFYRLLHRHGLR
jgi:transcriptional regulator with PAS, ATPase and Fis domain